MSTHALERALPARPDTPERHSWAYVGERSERDLRVDFMRGVAMWSLLTVHMAFYSAFNLLAWERIGPTSSAGPFVILSGFVLGGVSRRRLTQEGFQAAAWKLWERAGQLYRVNVAVILVVGLVAQVPFWDARSITTFEDWGSGAVYSAYPPATATLKQWLGRMVLLRMGPHQIQVLGLYACLLVLAPAALYLLAQGRTRWLLGISWMVYLSQWSAPVMPTGAQFEYGFPVLTWQVIFFHGLAAGFHREALLAFYARHRAPLLGAALLVAGALCFFVQNNPNPFVPPYARLSLIPPERFFALYTQLCGKNDLGPLRILDNAALLVVGGELLTWAWVPLRKAFGWFFIPLGQATLYVFVVHVFVVMAVANIIPFGFSKESWPLLRTTLCHAGAFAVLWLMVRHQVLFRWIPR